MSAAGSQAERRRARAEVGTLKSLDVAPRTHTRYTKAVSKYFRWCDRHQKAFPKTRLGIDALLTEYIETLWQEGDARADASDVLSGIQFFIKPLKGHLREAWHSLGIWQKHEAPDRAWPFGADEVMAMAGFACHDGDVALGASLLAGFTGILRTCEMFSIEAGALEPEPNDNLLLNLGWTKGALRHGAPEHVVLDDAATILLLKAAAKRRQPGDKLVGRSMSTCRRDFSLLVKRLHLKPELRKPYGIRRGGATFHFRSLRNLGLTTTRGRWRHQTTCRIYIDEAAALLSSVKHSWAQKAAISRGQQFLKEALAKLRSRST